jgi:hypothetical protein
MASLSDSLAWLFIKFVILKKIKKRLKFPQKLANLIKLTPEKIISQFVEKKSMLSCVTSLTQRKHSIEQQENRPAR